MLVVRPIEEGDVDAVADVHVESWRVAYRGILPAFYARTGWSPLPVAPSVFEVRPGVGAVEVKYGRPLGSDEQGPGDQP